MHDIYSSQPEMSPETYEFGPAEFGYETSPEVYGEYGAEMTGESPLGEVQELGLTGELLEVSNEDELDRFLGGLISSVSRAVGKVIKSPIGSALGGILKGVAKRALPVVGGALGSFIAPGVGTALGSQLGSAASNIFGLELEGLSTEDRDFEVARRFTRFATEAARQAALSPQAGSPQATAQQAVAAAAQKYAPGLLSIMATPGAQPGVFTGTLPLEPGRGKARTGRWIRTGRNIILINIYR